MNLSKESRKHLLLRFVFISVVDPTFETPKCNATKQRTNYACAITRYDWSPLFDMNKGAPCSRKRVWRQTTLLVVPIANIDAKYCLTYCASTDAVAWIIRAGAETDAVSEFYDSARMTGNTGALREGGVTSIRASMQIRVERWRQSLRAGCRSGMWNDSARFHRIQASSDLHIQSPK